MIPTFNLPQLCRDLLLLVDDFASPATIAAQKHLADGAAIKEFAATAKPLLQAAVQDGGEGLTEAPARRILQGMATVKRLCNGRLMQSTNEKIKGFFVLMTTLAEALEHGQIPGQKPERNPAAAAPRPAPHPPLPPRPPIVAPPPPPTPAPQPAILGRRPRPGELVAPGRTNVYAGNILLGYLVRDPELFHDPRAATDTGITSTVSTDAGGTRFWRCTGDLAWCVAAAFGTDAPWTVLVPGEYP